MFKYKSAEDDLIKSMEENLISNAREEAFGFNKIAEAVKYLNSAADLFDDVGMDSESEVITTLIESLAAKSKKSKDSKSKDSKKSKKSKKSTKPKSSNKKAFYIDKNDPNINLTPEQMIENLKTNGTVFNMDADTVMMDDDSEEMEDSEEEDFEED